MTDAEKIAAEPTEFQRKMLEQQKRDWPKMLAGARQGNPWATLCEHCYRRHAPPNDDLCPNISRSGERARYAIIQGETA